MTPSIKRKQLLEWLATVFQESPDALDESRSRESIATWDSMGTLLLIAELDERLHVTLEEEELKKLTSIGDIFALLRRKQIAIDDE
jgi:acyl carrier protein